MARHAAATPPPLPPPADAAPPARAPLTRTNLLVGLVGLCGGLSWGYEPTVIAGLIINTEFLSILSPSPPSSPHSASQLPPPPSSLPPSSSLHGFCALRDAHAGVDVYSSSMFLVAAAAATLGAWLVDRAGRRRVLVAAWATALVAAAVQASAQGRGMLLAGRLLMGAAQGAGMFTPMFLAESAPREARGRFGAAFSIANCLGQLCSFAVGQLVYGSRRPQAWRVAFVAMTPAPALALVLLLFFVPDTPSSLLRRSRSDKALRAYSLLRHPSMSAKDREREFSGMAAEADAIIAAAAAAAEKKKKNAPATAAASSQRGGGGGGGGGGSFACAPNGAAACVSRSGSGGGGVGNGSGRGGGGGCRGPVSLWRRAVAFPEWPAVIILLHFVVVRLWNGFVNVMIYTAALFAAAGAPTAFALTAQTLMGCCCVVGGVLALVLIDKFGRRPLLSWSAALLAAVMAAAAAVLGMLPAAAAERGAALPPGPTAALLALLCVWQLVYWMSWSPVFYVVTSETFSLAMRGRATGGGVVVMMLCSFAVVQAGPVPV